MKKKIVALLAGALMMMATSAMALPFNENRPYDNGNLGSLQTVLNNNFSSSINAVTGQSASALWNESDAGSSSAFAIASLRGDSGNLGIYSSTGSQYILFTNPGNEATTSFLINANGDLFVNSQKVVSNFGTTFGFFWQDTSVQSTAYTEDSKNNNVIRALTYQVKDNTKLSGNIADYFSTPYARGNDDWVLAFEDRAFGDYDFNDAVFFVKDISAVPEPGTMVLLGAGLLGLAVFGKRRMNKEA